MLTQAAVDARSEGRMLQASLMLGGMLTVMASASLSPALPQLRVAFAEASDLQIRLVLTIPALMIVIASPLAGWIADHYGRKPLLLLSTLLYGLAGSSGYLAQDIGMLLAGRALVGVAVAGVMTCLLTLIVDYYSGAARARFLGLQAAISGLGGSLFVLLSGMLAEAGWRPPFLMYLLVLALLPFLMFSLYEPQRIRREEARDAARPGPALLRILLFVYVLVGLSQVVFNLVPLQLPFLLQERFNASATESGFAISLIAFFFAAAALYYGHIKKRPAHIPLAGLALALMGGSYLIVALAETREVIYAAMIISGLGLGLLLPNLKLLLANHSPEGLRGRLLGGFSASIYLGQFLSPVLFQMPATTATPGALWQNVGLALVVAGLLLWLLRAQLERLFQGGPRPLPPFSPGEGEKNRVKVLLK